ncbi:DUF6875 domain-containing protein [Pseudomonas sp. NPDC089734]|uniref:DUF6875 domain-containing protein n=1 Tax=Pseudomonas sp. NPDC089734 TaxID=3364469 RepID=UPI00381AD81D
MSNMKLSQPTSRGLNLVPISEALRGTSASSLHSESLTRIARWCVEYLCKPHPEVGRSGVVCPWTPAAMKRETFWLVDIYTQGRSREEINDDILSLIDSFKRQLPHEGNATQFKTIVGVLHGLEPSETVNTLHARLKPAFLDAGLMLGEFYEGCEKPGLRNQNFRPLRAPTPLLVVREMVEIDIAFLADRPAFIDAYLRQHGDRGKVAIRQVLNQNEKLAFTQTQIDALRAITRDGELAVKTIK